MKNTFKAIALFVTLASLGGTAFAQSHSMMDSHKGSSMQSMMTANQMMTMCEQMMKNMRSDPVLMKHMNAIMQKHMMNGGMMNGGMMNGGMMNGGMMNGNMHNSMMNVNTQSHSMMASHHGSRMQSMMTADQMMAMCEQMMKNMRSDPVLMKHMNAIMQKHMMNGGMMNGNMHNGMMNGPHPIATPHR